MKLGAERKKLIWLVGLLAVAGGVYWMNSTSDAPAPSAASRPAADSAAVAPVVNPKSDRRRPTGFADGVGSYNFVAPATVDPAKVDPTLRLELLAKVQSMESEGGVRNIFKREAAPPEPVTVSDGKIPKVDPLHPNAAGPQPPPKTEVASIAKPPVPPPAPGAPPIGLKYYGYARKRSDGEKKAFFLDGDDVIVAAEGEIIKKQYKVVRITDTSVQMEDTGSKSTQTLPIQEAAPV